MGQAGLLVMELDGAQALPPHLAVRLAAYRSTNADVIAMRRPPWSDLETARLVLVPWPPPTTTSSFATGTTRAWAASSGTAGPVARERVEEVIATSAGSFASGRVLETVGFQPAGRERAGDEDLVVYSIARVTFEGQAVEGPV